MHDLNPPNTDYSKNSLYEADPNTGQYQLVAGSLVLRDTDDVGEPGHGVPGPVDCIKSRGVNIRQNWLGEVVHYQNIVTQTFEIFFINPASDKNLQEWVNKLTEYENAGLWREELDLYGIKIPNCRITSIDAPTSKNRMQDGIGRGRLDITVEQRTCGDLESLDINPDNTDGRPREVVTPCYQCTENGLTTGTYVKGSANNPGQDLQEEARDLCYAECIATGNCTPAGAQALASGPLVGAIQVDDADPACVAIAGPGNSTVGSVVLGGETQDYQGLSSLLSDVCPYIEDINEDFKFNYGKGNSVSFTHSVSIKLFDSCPKGVDPWLIGSGGPGQPGSKVFVGGDGTLPGDYHGDDGDMTDLLSVCREAQFNVDDALTLARKILDENIPNFGIAFLPGVLRLIDDYTIIPYYTESQNLITGEVSMSKRMTLYDNRDDDLLWSAQHMHSLTVDKSGIVSVTEKGKIRGNKRLPDSGATPIEFPHDVPDIAYQNAISGMEEVIGTNFSEAETRCKEFWEAHREFYQNYFDSGDAEKPDKGAGGEVPVELHVEHPMTKTRSFNEVTRECSYSITFSTSPNIFQDFMANRTLTASRGAYGSITIEEKSDLTQYTPKGEDHLMVNPAYDGTNARILDISDALYNDPAPLDAQLPNGCGSDFPVPDNPIEIIFPEDYKGDGVNTGAKARVMSFYNDLLANTIDFTAPNPQGCTDPLKMSSRRVNWSPSGRGMSYSIKFTTDKTISCDYPDKYGIRKTEVSTTDKLPKRMFREHAIANNRMLVHDPKQTKLGSRTVNLNVRLERIPKHNMLINPQLPRVALDELAARAKAEILNVFKDHEDLVADDMYVKLCKYSFNSKWEATLTVAIDYIQKK